MVVKMVMMVRAGMAAVAAALAASPALAHKEYQKLIPNGANVVDDNGDSVPGVGHERARGGGARNQFGLDFAAANYEWTVELCNKDSDGDGLSNGVELGDPDCEWKEGDQPRFDAGISDPGHASLTRSIYSYCDEYVEPAATQSFTVTMPAYSVPSKDTTYAKYLFDGQPSGTSYVTRIAPIIEQEQVVHHMLLYACEDTAEVRAAFETPNEAGTMAGCRDLVYAWAVGGDTFCMPDNVGFKLEGTGRVLVIEVHYDNPNGISGVTDSSGLELFYSDEGDVDTETFQAAAWAWIGAAFSEISIPAGNSYYELSATGVLPNVLPENGINIFAVFEHGHKIATKIWTTVTPGDTAEDAYLASCNPNYDFDLQETKSIEKQLNLNVGDRLTVHCVYDSTSRTSPTTGGDATSDEMCIGLFMYYPAASTELRALVHDVESSTGSPLSLAYDSKVSCGSSGDAAYSLGSWITSAPKQLAFHAIMMILAWIVLIPGGTLPPLLLKHKGGSAWFIEHKAMMGLGIIFTLAAFVSAVLYKNGDNFGTVHGQLGLAVVVLVVAHTFLAIVRPAKTHEARGAWEWAHHGLGRGLVVLALANIFLGIDQLELYFASGPAALLKAIFATIIAVYVLGSAVFIILRRQQGDNASVGNAGILPASRK